MSDIPIFDNRGGHRNVDANREMQNLRQRGFSLPGSDVHARIEARKTVTDVKSRGTVTDVANKAIAMDFRRKRAESTRASLGSGGGVMTREASNLQMVLPKVRQPMSSLIDKGIPFNVQDPKELVELRRWCRLFASTHPLVPLLIDVYSTFPVQGINFKCKDPQIQAFYEEMFLNDLGYEDFLPNGLLKEYFTVGEVTTLSHFNERLGTWASEEILNPDWVKVTKGLFVEEERVQLMVKEMVEQLRDAPEGVEESPSERAERNHEYQELVQHYPEIVRAAQQDDGLDIADDLVSRIVNKASWNDTRGTPQLLRSFRTLMLEESLHAAEDAVCVLAGTPILTDGGVSYIEDVAEGDRVLTHRGRYQRVLRTMKREADEPGVTMRWHYDRPLTLTGEHPVWVRRPMGMPSHHYSMRRHEQWAEGFVPAREVKTYDQVWHPGQPQTGKGSVSIWEHLDPDEWVTYDPQDESFGMSGHDWYDNSASQTRRVARDRMKAILSKIQASPGDVLRHDRFGSKARHFAANYKLTDDLLWLIGLHVADGSAQVRPHGTGTLVIALGADEVSLQERAVQVIRDTFGVDPLVRPAWGGKKAVNITVNSLPLTSWFRAMCGVDDTKRFPSWAFGLTPAQSSALLEGWFDGDGHRAVQLRGVTAYRSLQEQAARLLRQSGHVSTVHALQSRWPGNHGGGTTGLLKNESVARRAHAPTGDHSDGYWVEVRSVEHHQVVGTVYNLEVEEDNSYCAPIAVHNCDRLYAPMILATLGIEDMGGGEPWIPDQEALDELRGDIQDALAADFKVLVHNMGLQVTSVFGRESVPRFDADYERVDTQLMQAWGIGQAMIMGGTGGGGTYASSAINREICENLMKGAQNKVKAHMRKKMMLIAEAQEHWDYDLKGGIREPVYMEIEQFNEDTEEMEIVRVPKPLVPDIEFDTLNMRDESTERAFRSQLKELGVPVSDGYLSLGVDIDFEQELETQAAETYAKGMAQAQVMDKLQKKLDSDGLPYPAELVQFLQATLTIRSQLAETELAESQNKLMDQQLAQSSPAGMLGLLPGTSMQPLPGLGMPGSIGADPSGQTLPQSEGGNPGDPSAEGGAQPAAPGGADPSAAAGAAPAADPSMQMAASFMPPGMHGPTMGPPGGVAPRDSAGGVPGEPATKEPARNRMRPEESDEMRDGAPKLGTVTKQARDVITGEPMFHESGEPVMISRALSRFEKGASYYRKGASSASEKQVSRAVRRREIIAAGGLRVDTLIHDRNFWETTNMSQYEGQVVADWPEIQNGGAQESRKLLEEALEQYEEATGIVPDW